MDPSILYRLVKALKTTRSLVPLALAALTILAVMGVIEPLGDRMDDDDCAL